MNDEKKRAQLGIALWVLSLVLLLPGLTQPILSITGSIDKHELAELGKDIVVNSPNMVPMFSSMVSTLVENLDLRGTVVVYEKTRSILGTVSDLWKSGDGLVAILIVTFSVIIPLIKAGLVVSSFFSREGVWKTRSLFLNSALSKWSMADVYVMAIIVAYLAVSASNQGGGSDLLQFEAVFENGFWFFVSFCLVSVASSWMMQSVPSKIESGTEKST